MKREYFRRQSINDTLTLEERLCAYDSLVIYAGDGRTEALLDKGRLLQDYGHFTGALALVEEVHKDPSLPLPLQLRADALKGEILFDTQRYADSFREIQKLLNISKPDSLLYNDVAGKILLAKIFMRLDNRESVEMYLQQAESLMPRLERQPIAAAVINALKIKILSCQAWLKLKDHDAEGAFGVLEQALGLEPEGDMKAQLINNIGYVFVTQGEYDIAREYFKEAISVSNTAHRPSYIVNYIASLSDRKEWKDVLDNTVRYSRELEKLPEGADRIKHYTALSEAYYNLGRFREACEVLLKQQQLQETVFSEEFYNNLSRQIHECELEQQAELDRLAKLRERRRNILIYSIAGVLILLLAGGAGVIWKLRRRSRAQSSHAADLQARYHAQSMAVDRQEESLGKLNKELTTLSMKMARLYSTINELGQKASDPTLTKEQLRVEITDSIRDLQNEENIWEMFKSYFEQVNQKFFDNLYRLHPTLTPAEIRMCAYTLTGLTVKEIAVLTNRSSRTVESIRYGLRKKMGITGSTEAYMRYLSTLDEDKCDRVAELPVENENHIISDSV